MGFTVEAISILPLRQDGPKTFSPPYLILYPLWAVLTSLWEPRLLSRNSMPRVI